MHKTLITILLTLCISMPALAYCPSRDEDITGYIQCQNNNWIVPEQWGFRSGKTIKESYLMDMKSQWEQTKDEWTNTYNKKPIQSNLRQTVGQIIVYPNQFKSFYIPKQVTNYLP